MKKFIAFILILLILLGAGIVYLNKVYLPAKIKSLVIQGIQTQTHKRVSLGSVQFNLFKGLVLKNLSLYDNDKTILSLREGSCTFLIWPFFKKQLVIPSVSLDSAVIFLERRADKSFNWQDILTPDPSTGGKDNFGVIIYKIHITRSRIDYLDGTLTPDFTKSVTDLDLVARFSLPASVKFQLKGQVPAKTRGTIAVQGEYNIPRQELSGKFSLFDINPGEFSAYYQGAGVKITDGLLDISGGVSFKDNNISGDITLKAKNISFSKDKIAVRLNSDAKVNLSYGLVSREFKYSGSADITGTDISGIDFVEEIKGISGTAQFDNARVSLKRLDAQVLGLPVQAGVEISRFNEPMIEMNITGNLPLVSLKGIASDKFKVDLPIVIDGKAQVSMNLNIEPSSGALPKIDGYFDLADTSVKLEKQKVSFEGINGRINFTLNSLSWSGVDFKFLNNAYKTSGALANFARPIIELTVASENLKVESSFSVNNKLIAISKLNGNYFNSDFSCSGDIDTAEVNKPEAQLTGNAGVELADIPKILTQFKEQLAPARPEGKVKVKFSLSGNIADIKSCRLQSEAASDAVSLWGLKGSGLSISLGQQDSIIEISQAHLSLYDGSVDLTAKMNLASKNLPFWFDFSAKDIRIEKLKLDTLAKDKDIAGIIQAQGKINGFPRDMAKMTGAGKIAVTEGKLWELNLFKGLGKLIFARDFESVMVSEASCSFVIQDSVIATDNLKMLSNLAEISGPVKIGFDGSLNSELSVNILGESTPATGTVKDITTAIIGQAGKFGTIAVSGSLKDPKYKFKPSVADIFKSIKNAIFGN
ncbi:MAG: DUF748 domain-containing protein [Candidatus Omnitrophica bacterium]|nr:DUF748 domain-containing protein [Candidatus Omnitrophota bacterium]